MDPDRLERLAERLAEGCRRHLVPGAQVGVLRAGRRTVLSEGTTEYGGGVPVDAGTYFHAGSVAKALTALVVLDADARGELDVELPCHQQSSVAWDDTPMAIMAQTTGRPNELPAEDEGLAPFVVRVTGAPRVHAPGRFSYCNAGWSVLDLLLRERVGASFEELARERVLGPTARFGEPAGASRGHGVRPDSGPVVVGSTYAEAASAAGSRWWVTADELLDFAALHLDLGAGRFDEARVAGMQQPRAVVPGATVSDYWGLGWAVWQRPGHRAYGWAGLTLGHRTYLRCFPDQQAAVVVLANCAGPLFGPPGGSALFDDLLPLLLDVVGVPLLPGPDYCDAHTATALAGDYGPFEVRAAGPDRIELQAAALGEPEVLSLTRSGGDTFEVAGRPPGAIAVAFDEGLLYLGPFAVSRNPEGAVG